MKVLYIDLDKIVKNDILWGLIELGIDVERYEEKIAVNGIDYVAAEKLEKVVWNYNIVITQNFTATVAEACHRKKVPYISWIYDAPQLAIYCDEAKYDECYIFMFDKSETSRLKEVGIPKVYHRPLAANLAQSGGINITDEDIKKYSSDVAFVGTIYSNDYYKELYNKLSPDMQKHFDAIIENNYCKWNGNRIFDTLDEAEIELLYNGMNKAGLERLMIPQRTLIEVLVFSKEIAGRERVELINEVAQICDTVLYTYTPDNYKDIIKARLCEPVYMENEMYKVFYASKINLNMTLRGIETGLPQRIFDIMSVGGFVMSNWQEEIGELFDIDKDIVVYHSVDEYLDKVKYYLDHENERVRVGVNGYMRVRDNYTYPIILKQMLDFVCKDWGIV